MERSAPADRRAQRQRRQQLLEAARSRYPSLSYQEKGALVDELVALSEFHRKSVLRLFRQQPADHGGPLVTILTPADRLLRWSGLSREDRQRIEAFHQQCDPVDLLETIRWNQAALVNGESEESIKTDQSASNHCCGSRANLPSAEAGIGQSAPTARGWIQPWSVAPCVAVADGRSLAHRPTSDATAGARTPWAVSRQPAHLAEADG